MANINFKIHADVSLNEDGTYSAHITSDGSSGEWLPFTDSKVIGEHVTELIEILRKEFSKSNIFTSN